MLVLYLLTLFDRKSLGLEVKTMLTGKIFLALATSNILSVILQPHTLFYFQVHKFSSLINQSLRNALG